MSNATTLLSMTGLGVGEAPLAQGLLRVELRALNHRHIEVRVRAAPELIDASSLVEDEVRAACGRGRIEAQLRWESGPTPLASLDGGRLRHIYGILCQFRDELAPGQEVPLSSLLNVPGVFTGTVRFEGAELAESVRAATRRAILDLTRMRAVEGEALAKDLRRRAEILGAHAVFLEGQRVSLVHIAQVRMRRRIERLLEGTDIPVDSARLAQEVAWFADKSDVSEELTRLKSHVQHFLGLLNGGDHVGKRLDFLIQEIGREINTTGAKANDAGVSQRVVEMKAELERLREQVQNVL